jgi:hypothetical protein
MDIPACLRPKALTFFPLGHLMWAIINLKWVVV